MTTKPVQRETKFIYLPGDVEKVPVPPLTIERLLKELEKPALAPVAKARRPIMRLVVEKKYDPSQPRAPKGSPIGGQWVDEGGAAGAPTAAGSMKFYKTTRKEDADRLDRFGVAGGNVERLKRALTVQGYDAEILIGFSDDKWINPRGEWSEGTTFTGLVEYRKDGERVGRVAFFVSQDKDAGLYVFRGLEREGFVQNSDFIAAAREQELDDQMRAALQEMGWIDQSEARWTPLSPAGMQDFYSERERSLLAFPTGHDSSNRAHQEARAKAKADGEMALGAAGVNVHDAYWIQTDWADTSNDDGGCQDALQEEALSRSSRKSDLQETTGIQTIRQERSGIVIERPAGTVGKVKIDAKAQSVAYDSINQRTQDFFKAKGLSPDDEIVLYRGVQKDKHSEWNDVKVGEKVKIRPRPLTSWSLSFRTAANVFASPIENKVGIVYAVRVPVKYAFAHASTGFGCLAEEEVILLGDGLVGRDLEIAKVNR